MGTNFPAIIRIDQTNDNLLDYETGSSDYTTTSLQSSIYNYRYEHGRRYHAYKEGKYVFPNDEAEQDRLDVVHHMYLLLMDDKLHLAPIDPNPQKILDVGTGTGIWAIDAGEYQSAEVIGIDLSPIQPSWVPPNVQFQVDDVESEWTFKDPFDLIHIRDLTGAISDWGNLISEAYKHCKPGGWIDLTEYEMGLYSDDGSLTDNLELKKFYDLAAKATEKTGRRFNISKTFRALLEKAGFTDIHHKIFKAPLGPWAADRKLKEVGAYALLTVDTGFSSYGIKLFTEVLGMETDAAKHIIKEASRQAKSKKLHAYGLINIYYAQKPPVKEK